MRVMPGLFGAIQGPIDAHLQGWHSPHLDEAKERHLASLMQALGKNLMGLKSSEYEAYLGPYSGYTMRRIGMWLVHTSS